MTICTSALYLMFHTERITRDYFRVLVLGIFLSLIYDGIWFWMKHSEYTEEQKADGGQETNIRRIVLLFAYVAFLLKVIIVIINRIDICGFSVLEGLHGFRQDHPKQRARRDHPYAGEATRRVEV